MYVFQRVLMVKVIKEYIFLVDKSISMHGRESQVIHMLNHFLKIKEKDSYITLGMFSDTLRIIYIHNEGQCVQSFSERDYYVEGATAYYDAVCEICQRVEHNLSMLRQDIEKQIELYVISDGMDNASIYYDENDYEEEIKKRQENGWEFHRFSPLRN